MPLLQNPRTRMFCIHTLAVCRKRLNVATRGGLLLTWTAAAASFCFLFLWNCIVGVHMKLKQQQSAPGFPSVSGVSTTSLHMNVLMCACVPTWPHIVSEGVNE